MVALPQTQSLDLANDSPPTARQRIKDALERDPRATRRVYAALARKTWSLLIERRLDPELRDWHGLLFGVRAKIKHEDEAAAERLIALADLLRESLNLAEISPARSVAERPKSRAVLELLRANRTFVRRRHMLDELDIGGSHLSNILTQLLAHDLVERRGNGKEAEYRITPFGQSVLLGKPPSAIADDDTSSLGGQVAAIPLINADALRKVGVGTAEAALEILRTKLMFSPEPPPFEKPSDDFVVKRRTGLHIGTLEYSNWTMVPESERMLPLDGDPAGLALHH
jgi:predicted transcriptional regulator